MTTTQVRNPYLAWETRVVDVHGQPIVLSEKPGQTSYHHMDYPSLLLAEYSSIDPGDAVVHLECGSGLAGIATSRATRNGRVTLASPNLVDVHAARRSTTENGRENIQVIHSSGAGVAEAGSVDVVIARNPKGRFPSLRLNLAAYRMLRPGGRFYLAGSGDEGIQSSLRRVERLFHNLDILDFKKGCRIGVATKTEAYPNLPDEYADPVIAENGFHRFNATIGGHGYIICSRPGVFSWDGPDPGALTLIEAMKVGRSDSVLDLGCGTGIVGIVARTRTDSLRVTLVDVDSDAVASTVETARANNLKGVTAVASDSIAELGESRFDVVVSNPPFHVGHATVDHVAREFMRGAAGVLAPEGRAYIVANRFLPYESVMGELFGSVESVYADRKFKVLLGRRPVGGK